jgi:hypothetical protein
MIIAALGRTHNEEVKLKISSKLGNLVNLYEIQDNKEFHLIATFVSYRKAAAFLFIRKTTVKT